MTLYSHLNFVVLLNGLKSSDTHVQCLQKLFTLDFFHILLLQPEFKMDNIEMYH